MFCRAALITPLRSGSTQTLQPLLVAGKACASWSAIDREFGSRGVEGDTGLEAANHLEKPGTRELQIRRRSGASRSAPAAAAARRSATMPMTVDGWPLRRT